MALARGTTILVDTNVIIAAHRCGVWNPLAKAYQLDTVEKCVEETQTGFQNRRPEETIDNQCLQPSLRFIAVVNDFARAELIVRCERAVNIDDGERDLLANALTRTDAFLLASPDRAAMHTAIQLGWGDRLVSLEEMVIPLSVKLSNPLKYNFTSAWMSRAKTEILMSLLSDPQH